MGFTLVELLVVVAIIGILCVLLLSAFPRVLAAADTAKCASNLRTVGQAVGFYVNDNSYMIGRPTLTTDWYPVQGQLPGPVNGGQMPVSSWQFKSMFGYLLSPYLGLPEPTGAVLTVPLLQCPAWKKQTTTPSNVSYLAPNVIVNHGITNQYQPFGVPQNSQHPLIVPMRMVALPVPVSGIVVLQDVDQQDADPAAWPTASLPLKPVHNGRRNYLYLDGHVETK